MSDIVEKIQKSTVRMLNQMANEVINDTERQVVDAIGDFKSLTRQSDEVLMRFTDVLYGMPFLPFIIVLISLFGRELEFVILAIVLIIWRTSARVIRAQTISIKQRQFIAAARARGCSHLRIIYRHILPNVLPLLLLYAAFNIAWSIITEASASFLGFGDGETISWGGMLYELWLSGKTRVAWWWFTAPSLCIVLLVTSLVFVSRAYEEVANPRLRKR